MAEGFINQTEGSGKKAHTFQKTIGANTVEDQVVIAGIPYLPTYSSVASGVSVATANSHVLQLMAGASLNVYVLKIVFWQLAAASTAAFNEWRLYRLTTAGTGGSALTEPPHDTTAAASGAQAMTLPTVKGTEDALLDAYACYFTQTPGAAGVQMLPVYRWEATPDGLVQPIRIPAGAANGIALKNISANAAVTVSGTITYIEANF